MKFNKKLICILVSSLAFTGCKSMFSDHVKCDDVEGLTLVKQVLQDDLASGLEKELKSLIRDGAIKDLDPTKLKLSANSIQFNLSDSRTDFIDPNSSKTTCSLDLSVNLPSDLVKKSDEARNKVDVQTVEEQASKLAVNYDSNKINLVLEYVLQPTTKGDKVLAILHNTQPMQTLIADTLTYAFLKPQIEKNKAKSIANEKANQSQMNSNYEPEYTAESAAQEAVDAAMEATAAADASAY